MFFGDRLDEGGNDYPVTTLGVRCISVDGPDDTLAKVAVCGRAQPLSSSGSRKPVLRALMPRL